MLRWHEKRKREADAQAKKDAGKREAEEALAAYRRGEVEPVKLG